MTSKDGKIPSSPGDLYGSIVSMAQRILHVSSVIVCFATLQSREGIHLALCWLGVGVSCWSSNRHSRKCTSSRCWIISSEDSVHLPFGRWSMPSLPLGEDAKIFLSHADYGTPSIRAQKECHDSLLHRLITFLNSRLAFRCCSQSSSVRVRYATWKALLAFFFKSVSSGFHHGTFLHPPILRRGQAFWKEPITALFRLVSSLSISPGVVTLPIHIAMDWFNSWSYTDQFVHRGLRLKPEGFLSRFNVKVIYWCKHIW